MHADQSSADRLPSSQSPPGAADVLQDRELLQSLMEASADSIYFKDSQSRFLKINNALAQRFGLADPAQAVGKTDRDMYAEPHALEALWDERQILATGEPLVAKQERETWPDGQETWTSTNKAPLRNAAGEIVGVIGISHDITQRKLVLDALTESETRFRSLFASMTEGVAIHRVIYDSSQHAVDYEVIEVNPAFEIHTGIPAEKANGRFSREVYGTPDPPYLNLYAEVAGTGQPRNFETFHAVLQRHFSISVFSPKKGWFVTVFSDVTQRSRQDAEIRRLNRIYALLSQVNQTVVRVQSSGELFPQVCDITIRYGEFKLAWVGWIDDETREVVPVASAGASDYLKGIKVFADDRPEGRGPVGTAIRTLSSFICNDFTTSLNTAPWWSAAAKFGLRSMIALPIRKNGTVRGALAVYAREDNFFHSKEIALLEEVAGDISFALDHLDQNARRLEAEEAVRQSEREYRSLIDHLHSGVVVHAPDTRILMSNPEASRLLGLTSDQMRGKVAIDPAWCFRREDGDRMPLEEFPVNRVIATGEILNGAVLGIDRGTGAEPTWVLVTAYPEFNELGRLHQVVVTFVDITARKQTERRLRQLSRAVEQSPSAVLITDTEGRIEYVNPKFTAISGYTLEETIGQKASMLKSGLTPPEVYKELWQTVRAGGEWRGELHNRKKNGELFWESASICAITDEGGKITHFLAVKEDITERKLMIERFLRAQRMESIGSLAGGVAHDLNNILAPIMMSASMLNEDLPAHTFQQFVTTIGEAAQRGADIVRQLLTFARGVDGHRTVFAPKLLFEQLERILRETFPKSIAFTVSVADDLWSIVGDLTQLHQVLLNLCVNARDAMPEGGTLELSATNCDLAETSVFVSPDARPGRYLRLAVADSGSGISKTVVDKIFDPFFTTKEPGKGTGLGLSTALGIVRSHGGFMVVDSELGRGSNFQVFLPAVSEVQRPPVDNAPPDAPAGNGETILIVDDEPEILKVTQAVLTRFNYKVIQASHGVEALAKYQADPAAVSLVLTDLMMPVMDGIHLARALKEISPGLRIVATSGHGEDAHRSELVPLGVEVFLKKPFSMPQLLTTLHDALAGR